MSDEIQKFLDGEIHFHFGEDFLSYRPAGNFEYHSDKGVSRVAVYEVTLESGRKVFAAEGALPEGEITRFIYIRDFPDPETAGKYHLYGILLDTKITEEEADAFANRLGLPQDYRVVNTGDFSTGYCVPDTSISPREEANIVEKLSGYLNSIGIDYDVAFNSVKSTGFGDYSARVMLKDIDGTELEFDMYLDETTLEIRGNVSEIHGGETTEFNWKPTKDQIEAAMAGRKQYYVLVVTRDKKSADELARELYEDDSVLRTELGETGSLPQTDPITNNTKPEELERKEKIKDSIFEK